MIDTTSLPTLTGPRIVQIHNALCGADETVTRFSSKAVGLARLLHVASRHPAYILPARFPDAFPVAVAIDKGEAHDSHVLLFAITVNARETAAATLTENEKAVLRALATNDFIGTDGADGLTWAGTINDARQPSGLTGKALAGTVSSLVRKGLVRSSDTGKDATIGWATPEAYALARDLADTAEEASALDRALAAAPSLVSTDFATKISAAGIRPNPKTKSAAKPAAEKAMVERASGPKGELRGKRAVIWSRLTQEGGVRYGDLLKELGWVKAQATIGKVVRSQGYEVVAEGKGDDRVYSARKPSRRARAA